MAEQNKGLYIDTSDIEGDLAMMEKRGRSLTTPMRTVAVIFKNAVLKNFKEGGRVSNDPNSPIGGNIRWQKLAPATVLSRLRKQYGGTSKLYTKNKSRTRKGVLSSVRSMKILQDDGTLKKSITATATNDSAQATTNLAYAPLQHFGGRAGRGRKIIVPARPFLQVQPIDVENSKDIVVKYIFKDISNK